jgi:hypothetical protein
MTKKISNNRISSTIKILCFDLDGVICKTIGNNYTLSKPIKNNIKFINKLYKEGFIIKIFTARFMGRSKENINLAKQKGQRLTKMQLSKWRIKYHYLIMGKPSYDLFIDDKAYGFKKNWAKTLKNSPLIS